MRTCFVVDICGNIGDKTRSRLLISVCNAISLGEIDNDSFCVYCSKFKAGALYAGLLELTANRLRKANAFKH
ncbi:MAG: hypothetical protein M0Q19_06740 [Candidatus Cloacimonetes bacterium]|nr:hypothetical protein [Candidatus Cloacimonadota bacterium]